MKIVAQGGAHAQCNALELSDSAHMHQTGELARSLTDRRARSARRADFGAKCHHAHFVGNEWDGWTHAWHRYASRRESRGFE
eukprot:6186134-Pleurochrysis_carterae.AAC.2